MDFLLRLKKGNMNNGTFLKNNVFGIIFLFGVMLLQFEFKGVRFNNIIDFFSIVLMFFMTVIYFSTKELYTNNFLKFLSKGICFIFVLKLIFIIISLQFYTQIQFKFFGYITMSYIRSVLLILSFRYINKEFNSKYVFVSYSLILLGICMSMMYFDNFFEIQSIGSIKTNEFILLVLNIVLFKIAYKNKNKLDKITYRYIIGTVVLAFLSTLSLVFSKEFKDVFYILEYCFDMFTYFCLYKCILNGSIVKITEKFKFNSKSYNNGNLKSIKKNILKTSEGHKAHYEDFLDKLDIPLIIVKEDYMIFSNETAVELIGNRGKLKYKYISKYWNKYKEFNENEYMKNDIKEKMKFENEIISLEDNKKIKVNINLFNIDILGEKYLCITIKDQNTNVSLDDFNKLKEDNNNIKNRDIRRTEFFANLSHDFKTPINVIYTAIQVMDIGVENKNIEAIKKYTKIMKQNCYRLLRLINNLIDATKIDAGYYNLNLENNDIVSLIEDIVTSVSGYVQHNDMDIIFDTDVEEKKLACDKDLIERAFLNLISNAIKYKKEGQGEIFINISTTEEMVFMSVKDNGMGIPKEKQRIIFERFIQASSSLDKNCSSSGIGLSLVKSIADMHEGYVDLHSKEGVGSEFVISLPVKLVTNDKAKKSEMNVKSKKEKINIEFSDVYTIK